MVLAESLGEEVDYQGQILNVALWPLNCLVGEPLFTGHGRAVAGLRTSLHDGPDIGI